MSMACSYDLPTQYLKIYGPVDYASNGPKNFTLNLKGAFRNPYSGKPRKGYVLSTHDSNGNLIDQNNALTIQST